MVDALVNLDLGPGTPGHPGARDWPAVLRALGAFWAPDAGLGPHLAPALVNAPSGRPMCKVNRQDKTRPGGQ